MLPSRDGVGLPCEGGPREREELEVQLPRELPIAGERGVVISAVSRGTMLAMTEMTPRPATDMRGSVRLSSPESTLNPGRRRG